MCIRDSSRPRGVLTGDQVSVTWKSAGVVTVQINVVSGELKKGRAEPAAADGLPSARRNSEDDKTTGNDAQPPRPRDAACRRWIIPDERRRQEAGVWQTLQPPCYPLSLGYDFYTHNNKFSISQPVLDFVFVLRDGWEHPSALLQGHNLLCLCCCLDVFSALMDVFVLLFWSFLSNSQCFFTVDVCVAFFWGFCCFVWGIFWTIFLTLLSPFWRVFNKKSFWRFFHVVFRRFWLFFGHFLKVFFWLFQFLSPFLGFFWIFFQRFCLFIQVFFSKIV